MSNDKIQIYWANSLFTDPDRSYNEFCASRIRKAGYNVFLPQEATVNEGLSPTPEDIFRKDSAEILKSNLMVACIDQETIDSGVACEIGLAYAYNIPIIGLYTDIRQNRKGTAGMYKNLYVVGAINAVGEIVNSLDNLIENIPRYLYGFGQQQDLVKQEGILKNHYNAKASEYSAFVEELESWYHPPWVPSKIVDTWIKKIGAKRIMEFGSGTGNLGKYLCGKHIDISYLGYDFSERMIEISRAGNEKQNCRYTSQIKDVLSDVEKKPFDLAVTLFTLHGHADKAKTLTFLRELISPEGLILIIDLSTDDLPNLNQNLRKELARPILGGDSRIGSALLGSLAEATKLKIVRCQFELTNIEFKSIDDLDRYMEIFGIYKGLDLPLNLQFKESYDWAPVIKEVISNWEYPFIDQRAFIIGVLGK